jgi:hypothetical protein
VYAVPRPHLWRGHLADPDSIVEEWPYLRNRTGVERPAEVANVLVKEAVRQNHDAVPAAIGQALEKLALASSRV